jgi:tetratricopeptide (TPR) repeat protein
MMSYFFLAIVSLVMTCLSAPTFAGESDLPQTLATKSEELNAQETLRAYLQVQEQLRATQLAIERSRKESDEAAARNSETLALRLQAIEQSLASQRARELDAMQSSNRAMLFVAGTFAAIGFVALYLMAHFQSRTVSRLAEIAAALPSGRGLGAGPALAALDSGEPHLLTVSPPGQPNPRLLGAIERLEKRIFELEHSAHLPSDNGTSASNEGHPAALKQVSGEPTPAAREAESTDAGRITVLLGKGQSLLNTDNPEEALGCFDEVLTLDSNNTEALVKKGTALERLRKMSEAIECYDRAIAADSSMTIAYLYKGGLFNRMERFTEALECYEQALHAQESAAPKVSI